MKTFAVLICLLLQVITVYSGTCATAGVTCASGQNLIAAADGTNSDECCLPSPTCAQFDGITNYCVDATDTTIAFNRTDSSTACTGFPYCDVTEGSADWETCCNWAQATTTEKVWESEMTDSEASVSLVVCLIIFAIMWVCGTGFFCYYCQHEPQRMYTEKEKEEALNKKKKHSKDEEEGSSEEESS